MMAKAERGRVRSVLADRARDPLFGLSEGLLPRLVELDLGRIRPNPDQPRRRVEEESLADLAASIERHGLLQPILVREQEGGFVLVAGQRRLLAHERLGRATIPALLTTGEPDELALIENVQREDLSPIETAEALAALQARHGYSQDELGRVLGKAKSTVSEILSLNGLPETVKQRLRQGGLKLSRSVLVEMARADADAAEAMLAGATTVRSARASRRGGTAAALSPGRVARLLEELAPLTPAALAEAPELRALLARLHDRLGELLPD